jgi:phage shock protein A
MFQRLANLFRGFFGRFVSGLERANPEALLENEKENLRQQIKNFNDGLVHHAALCERLMRQVRKLEEEEGMLSEKTRSLLRSGDRKRAADAALRLQTVSRELVENRAQAEEAEKTFRDLVKARDAAVEGAKRKIEELRRGIDDMRIQESMAELNKMAAGLVTGLGDTGDTLARLESMIEDQRSRAAGLSRVAREALDMSEVEDQIAEQDASAEAALADFAAREGIELEGMPPTPAAEEASPRSMGPPVTETD